jgi:hypothetical protein
MTTPEARALVDVDVVDGFGLASAASFDRSLVVVDVGRGTVAPAGRGLVVTDVGHVGDGHGRGGTAAPTARDLIVVDAGRVGDGRGTAAPAVRGLVVVDVGLCYGHESGRTTTPDARGLVDVDVVDGFGLANALDGPGRCGRRPPLRSSPSCEGCSPRAPPSEYRPRSSARSPRRS